MNWKRLLWATTKETVNEFLQDRAMRLAAATAFYAVFSIGPLLVLTVGLAGVVLGEDAVRQQVVQQVRSYVGERAATLVSSIMSARRPGGSIVATILGAAALVIGATGAFGQLQDSLNTIWGVTTKPGKSMWAFIRDRCFSMAMVLAVGFVLLVSMILSAFVVAFSEHIGALVAVPSWLVPVLNDAMNFVVISILFALIFKVLPDVRIRWRDVWVGAVGTAFLFTVGKFLLGVYLAREATSSPYGAASSLVVILLYIYYASVILYFGAEFTQVYTRYRGAGIEPSRYAVSITDFERAEQGMPRPARIEAAVKGTTPNLPRPGAAPSLRESAPSADSAAVHFVSLAFIVGAATGLAWARKNAMKPKTLNSNSQGSQTPQRLADGPKRAPKPSLPKHRFVQGPNHEPCPG
jgi:membrane protein